MVYIFLADGFEEAEALVPLDILRRGGLEVKTVGVTGKSVTGSHGITVLADIEKTEVEKKNLEAVILPGGLPGATNLEKDEVVGHYIDYAAREGLVIGAICAAPVILGHKGLLNGKKAICFPGFEKELSGAEIIDLPAVCDGNIVTSWGAGGAFEFGFSLLSLITGDNEKTANLRKNMKYPL
ncbi:MAG: DJ-1/PfpI family protein [Ruminococcaceae bacterium]|nr:DJ-1/PfpI family protein [Oscillospiraceae bacterium]